MEINVFILKSRVSFWFHYYFLIRPQGSGLRWSCAEREQRTKPRPLHGLCCSVNWWVIPVCPITFLHGPRGLRRNGNPLWTEPTFCQPVSARFPVFCSDPEQFVLYFDNQLLGGQSSENSLQQLVLPPAAPLVQDQCADITNQWADVFRDQIRPEAPSEDLDQHGGLWTSRSQHPTFRHTGRSHDLRRGGASAAHFKHHVSRHEAWWPAGDQRWETKAVV